VNQENWNYLEKVSLPVLKFLRIWGVPSKVITSLIENTKGHLTEISIVYEDADNRLIQAIYQKCQNLRYLNLSFNNDSLLELEKLLINCQHLSRLVINNNNEREIDFARLFEILCKSSPIGLFKFRILTCTNFNLNSLKSFFNNWKNRHPMELKIRLNTQSQQQPL